MEGYKERENMMLCFMKVSAYYIFAELMKAGKEIKQNQKVIEKVNEMKGAWGEESLEPVMCGKKQHMQ